jgi:acetyltransferase
MDGEYRIHRYPTQLIDRVLHANGTMLTIRPVLPQDLALLQDFVAALSPEARHDRFHVGLSGLSDATAHYFAEVDYRKHLGIVAEAFVDDGVPRLVADARYAASDEDPAMAEMAVVVADAYRGRGLGTLLVRMLLQAAGQAGFAAMEGDVLATNRQMLALLARLGFRTRSIPGDARVVQARISLDVAGAAHGARRSSHPAQLAA